MLKKIFLSFLWLASAASAANGYDFAYSASGDPPLTPIQVFDDGKKTWIQLPRRSAQPAVFAVTPAGEVLIPARPEDQFFVVDRVEQKFALVLGSVRATVRYVGNAPRQSQAASFGATTPIRESGQAQGPVPAQEVLAARRTPPASPVPEATPVVTLTSSSPPAVTDAAQTNAPPSTQAAADIQVKPAILPTWNVGPQDQNFRLALHRWATEADWTFGSDFWAAPMDIPITAAATFSGVFEDAVRALVGATELGEHPLQPCFYSNRVLRVVPISHACNRTN